MARLQISAPAATWEASSLLREFYVAIFRPAARTRVRRKRLDEFDRALRRFERYVGGRPRLGDVTSGLLAQFSQGIVSNKTAPYYARKMANCIAQIIREWRPDELPRYQQLPPVEPGTLRHYFETIYRVEAMIGAKTGSVAATRRAIIALGCFVGHDVRLDEQTNTLAADFFRYLLQKGNAATGVNSGFRATWFAVWNHAADRGIVAAPRVKKLKEVRNEPDSWTVSEVERLLAAARRFRPNDTFDGVPCNLWWHAILLVCWWTGLRRGSLLSLQRADVDLEAHVLHVPGEAMKNSRGQQFILGEDAIAAIGRIWIPERSLLFPHRSMHVVGKQFGLLTKAAGVKPSRRKTCNKFHRLRRTVATQLAAQAGTAAASSLLGHSDSYVTRRYLDPSKMPGHDVTRLLPKLIAL